jgi:hypothetical protein
MRILSLSIYWVENILIKQYNDDLCLVQYLRKIRRFLENY